MAKTVAQIQAQIEKLQREQEALRAKEVAGVVSKIKTAIEHYGLTAEDLGLASKRGPKPTGKKAAEASGPTVAKKTKAKGKAKSKAKANAKPRAPASAKKQAGVIKYQDSDGNRWTGNGQRPGWFKDALATGKTAEDLLVKTSG